MFLRSLSMKGFKSFADPTVLEMEPGITVVVGPNGSGKSNVVDAVTWVLGAQGPRSLRSQRMEDVIFAGTSSRPALGRAEVSLTIDNASGRLPVDLAEVTISRTLFRSGDSEYAINGTPCRLLDIQELLSDSGVGRQQHMIIGQGQLDTVLNARPEDRRALIEEAAGVLKHRRRRERAERRLEATQENLERLGDLVRELRRQIRPLERQAAAARSHAALTAELREVRLHLAGSELAELAGRRRAAAGGLEALAAEERRLHEALAALDDDAATTAAQLASGREQDLAAALGRVQALVERARGTINVLRERSRAMAAALDAAADVDVVSTLEAEASRLTSELAAAAAADAALDPERAALAADAAVVEEEEQAHRERWGDGSEVRTAEEALRQARHRVDLQRRALDQQRAALADLAHRVAVPARRLEEVDTALDGLRRRTEELEAAAGRVAAEADAAEADHRQARERADEAERVAAGAEQDRHRTAARAEAFARALHELEGAGGREALAGVDGVVGSLVDLVEIDQGWEEAFEAAAGAAVAAVVVNGREAARQALSLLYHHGETGALLAAGGAAAGPRRRDDDGSLPPHAEPVRPHVRLRAGVEVGLAGADVDGVLDALVGRAVRVPGWEPALDLALDRPDLVVVTADGDRFASSGWRVRSSRGVVTAAAVDDARRTAASAADEADRARDRLRQARTALDAASAADFAAKRALDRHGAARSASAAEGERIAQERARLAGEVGEARQAHQRAEARLADDAAALAELEARVPELEASAAAAAARAESAETARVELDGRRAELAERRRAAEVRAAGVAERRRVLEQRRAEVERRLAGHAEEREAAAVRRVRLESDGVALARLGGVVDHQRQRLEAVLDTLRTDYRHQVEQVRAGGERLEAIRRDRSVAERHGAELAERSRLLDREAAEVSLRAEALAEMVRTELGEDPEEVRGLPAPELPDGVSASAHAQSLAGKLASLGPVNPLALDELSGLEERQQELETQIEDVRSARRELHEVVRTLDREIMDTFAAAAADVNEHFSALVTTLFPGGTGRLSLTDPENLLHTGVEVEVRPAGRNVRRVSLLSGGERSLAALAFLFAVFRSRPSPFYLMDEVEAALDDVNLNRFLGLVREFRDEAQLIIVSHQKRTMETADALYGVTMAPGGSSQVVSQRVAERSDPAEAPTAS